MFNPMTLQEFQEQARRLQNRFPKAYPFKSQVALAWHVHGLSREWFKTRVDYVIRSGSPDYDWQAAAKSARRFVIIIDESAQYPSDSLQPMREAFEKWRKEAVVEIAETFRVDDEAISEQGPGSFQQLLENEGATSAVDLLMGRWKKKEAGDGK